MGRTVGIDLGTSTSEIAYVKDGIPVLIPNAEGEVVTPSVVHIKENGEVLVGVEAEQFLFTRPDCTFIEVKRMFGTNTTLFAHGKEYTPEEIQSYIIKYLVSGAEKYLNEDITSAVITVPSYFTDIQRRQTIRAGEKAGLRIERVINEPTAAALDYGLQNLTECENILVYDFGGGTLDVTVLELFESVIDVKSSCGNNQLGGKDLDRALMHFLGAKHYAKIMEEPRAAMRLRQEAINCKLALGTSESYRVQLPLLIDNVSIDRNVTLDEFEAEIKSPVTSTKDQINGALADAKLSASDLQKVLLVGGTTRIPFVKEVVGEVAGIEPVTVEFPELTVARGAAIQAAIIDGIIEDERSVVFTDVCPFTLGAKVLSNRGLVVDPLIKRNTTIPYEYSKTYRASAEYQDAVEIAVYQGESESPYENTFLGNVNLSGLPKKRGEYAEVVVTFAYNLNGVLEVTAEAVGNGKSNSVSIDISASELKRPVKLSEWESAPNAKKYRPLIRKAMKIVDEYIGTYDFIETDAYVALVMVDELKVALIEEDDERIKTLSDDLKDFFEYWKEAEEIHFDDFSEKDLEKAFKELKKLFKSGGK